MGRQSGDSTVVNSSIALLQERFRQLERVREKREEKEMLKLFNDSDRRTPSSRNELSKSSFQLEMTRPTLQDYSLSVGLHSQSTNADSQATTPSMSTSLWPNGSASPRASRNFDNSDVDTSLHL